MHDLLVGDIAVREYDHIDVEVSDQALEVFLGLDRNAVRISRTGQFGRIRASLDVGNLRGGEGDDVVEIVVPEVRIEVMKIPACGAEDQSALRHDFLLPESFVQNVEVRPAELLAETSREVPIQYDTYSGPQANETLQVLLGQDARLH